MHVIKYANPYGNATYTQCISTHSAVHTHSIIHLKSYFSDIASAHHFLSAAKFSSIEQHIEKVFSFIFLPFKDWSTVKGMHQNATNCYHSEFGMSDHLPLKTVPHLLKANVSIKAGCNHVQILSICTPIASLWCVLSAVVQCFVLYGIIDSFFSYPGDVMQRRQIVSININL